MRPEAGTLTSPGKGARGHWLGRPVTSWPWQGRSREHIPPHTRPGVPNIPFQKKVHTGRVPARLASSKQLCHVSRDRYAGGHTGAPASQARAHLPAGGDPGASGDGSSGETLSGGRLAAPQRKRHTGKRTRLPAPPAGGLGRLRASLRPLQAACSPHVEPSHVPAGFSPSPGIWSQPMPRASVSELCLESKGPGSGSRQRHRRGHDRVHSVPLTPSMLPCSQLTRLCSPNACP